MNEDKATRYHRLKRRAHLASLVWSVALLVGLLWSGLTLTLRSDAAGIVSPTDHTVTSQPVPPLSDLAPGAAASGVSGTTTILIYTCLLMLVNEIGAAPIALYAGFLLERRYGLSNERFAAWAWAQLKSLVIGLLLASVSALALYGLIARSPRHWWVMAGLAFAVFMVGLTQLTPILLLPMFYRVKPLERESLRARLLALAERAGAHALGAYEWGLGDRTKKANAALAGLGSTRRILVSDTMLADYSDEEIEVVLAHELAHHVHGDIWKGIVFESGLSLAGFFLAARLLEALAVPLGLRGVGDIAGLPLLVLAAGAVSLVMLPMAHAISRACERNADRFALDLTRNPDAFISAMRRLGAQNLAEEHPSRIVQWLFYSHPPLRDRIAAAQSFANR
ncbi:MAG: M48 family metallopeptidase [Acidobacteriota bacterium]